MKNIIIYVNLIVLTIFLPHSTVKAQNTVQGTISKTGDTNVTVYAKPTLGITNGLFTNIIVTVSIPVNMDDIVPTLQIAQAFVPSLEWTLEPVFELNNRIFYTFNGTDNNDANAFVDWIAGADNPILELEFAGGPDDTSELVQLNDLTGDNGGTHGQAYWYIEQLGPGDLTDYEDKFYQIEGNQNYINGGLFGNSSIELNDLVSLPLTLLTFTASIENSNNVLLNWITEQEINTSHFELERSVNTKTWQKITVITAQNSGSVNTHYQYKDLDVRHLSDNANLPIYYRLKMVDLDESYEYSPIRNIRLNAKGESFNVFPNPTYAEVNFTYSSEIENITVYNLAGQGVSSFSKEELYSRKIDLSKFPAGVYFLGVNEEKGQLEQFVKVIKIDN